MKLLFIGNSHTYYNDTAALVQQLLAATGTTAHVTMLTRGGKSLAFHKTEPATRFNILYGGYDVVIAQDIGSSFDPAIFTEGATAIKEMAENAGARFMLYMPWANRNKREQQPIMTESYLTFSKEQGCSFAPGGEIFTRLLSDGTLTLDELYNADTIHATPLGSYAAAVTIFYTLTGRKRTLDPVKLNDPGIKAGYDPALCRRIHTEACFVSRLYNT